MLYPQDNAHRQTLTLSGFWGFRTDPEQAGQPDNWFTGLPDSVPIAVPASWNEQLDEYRDYLGDSWYETRFRLPWGWQDKRIMLRFDSVNYLADVWLNGEWLGQHEGGHLPFEFQVNSHLKTENNLLVVRVNGELRIDRVPPGNIPDPADHLGGGDGMGAAFDFFPFCGIQRPVWLYATSPEIIADVTVSTGIQQRAGVVHVALEHTCQEAATAEIILQSRGETILTHKQPLMPGETGTVTLTVPDATFWSPENPHLYNLTIALRRGDVALDEYTLPVGIRTISVQGDHLLLNGQPVKLRGFGRHEDFPIVGRGYLPALIIKDYQIMRWVGANSFRTTHYPYSEAMLDLADRLGFLIIDETPAVGLFFHEDGLERRTLLCKQYIGDLIARDKNHPSVIMWSLANEPINRRPEAYPVFQELFALARSLDSTRPITFAGEHGVSLQDQTLELCDVLCLNRYNGWYFNPQRLDAGVKQLSADLDMLHDRYPKPVLITEFGADSIPGWHANPPEMFSEEYQAEMMTRYIEVLESKPYVIGQHVWNLCDFKTGQSVRRANAMNYKGVFTRDRRPKLAAHRLRELWRSPKDNG
ncbi:MAG: beta-glucuronidase [Anaerolineae bacterium]|nr:beta-glucuronidase [Anaerolineae bacterium]